MASRIKIGRHATAAVLVALSFATAPNMAVAQDVSSKLAVIVEATAPDSVGQRLVFRLRDTIGRSGTFSEVAPTYEKGFKVEIVTLDPYKGTAQEGTTTIYSYVILGNSGPHALDLFFTTYVGVCTKPDECAQRLFDALGEQAETLRQQLRTAGRQ